MTSTHLFGTVDETTFGGSGVALSTILKLNELMARNRRCFPDTASLSERMTAVTSPLIRGAMEPSLESYISCAQRPSLDQSIYSVPFSRRTLGNSILNGQSSISPLLYLNPPSQTATPVTTIQTLLSKRHLHHGTMHSTSRIPSKPARPRVVSSGSIYNRSSSPQNLPSSPTNSIAEHENGPRNSESSNVVRKEKIIEALKSDSQRGKKRRELNDMERLELTRTRNREHAKITRLRKKARMEELLQFKAQMNTELKAKHLKENRIHSFQRFLAIRQDMVNNQSTSDDDRNDSETDDAIGRLEETVVHSIERFHFLVEGLSSKENIRSKDSAISSMNAWDRHVRRHSKIVLTSNQTEVPTYSSSSYISYEIHDGSDGIAISNGGIAFAHVDIVFNQDVKTKLFPCSRKKTVLLTAVMKGRFDDSSQPTKLSSFEICGITNQSLLLKD